MGKIEIDHTGSGGGITLSSDGTSLLLGGSAVGGGAALELYDENPSTPTAPSATGTNAVAIGYGSTASSTESVAIGDSTSSGINSIAIGENSTSSGNRSTAIGRNSFSGSADATAVGAYSIATTGSYANAFGHHAYSYGQDGTSIGRAYSSGTDSFAAAIGTNSSSYGASGVSSIAMGEDAKANAAYAISMGYLTTASGISSAVFGAVGSTASGTRSLVVGGQGQTASGDYSAVLGGQGNTASGEHSAVIGESSTASHANSVSIGDSVTSTAANQVNLGGTTDTVRISESYTLPTTDGSANQVLQTNGSGVLSFATVSGGGSPDLFAENYDGLSTLPSATGTNAFGIGVGAISSASLSIALGTSRAYGTESFACAIDNNSTTFGAGGSQAIAIGRISRAHGNQAIAIGSAANCSGNDALSIGENSTTSGRYGSTLGNSSSTSAEGASSIGYGNTINSGANSSVALGADNKNNSVAGKLTYGANDTVGSGEPAGSPKTGIQVIVAHTTDATATVATTPTSSGQATAASDTIPALPNNSAFAFHGTIIARESAAAGSDYASWEIKGALLRDANAASTVLGNGIVNSLYHTAGASAWAVALSADTTNGGLKVEVTGAAATNIRWAATVNTSEVIYA
jgi:trimeric autotransporter adhesin